MEIWKDILGYEGLYQVSSEGRVKREKILKQFKCNGYFSVNLSKDGKSKLRYVHDLVLSAFRGKKPKGMECRHYDGNKIRNKLSNLRYGTRRENMFDDELRLRDKPSGALLTREEVKKIKILLCIGENPKDITKEYNVKISTVHSIRYGKTWKHISWPDITKNFYVFPLPERGTRQQKGKLNEKKIISIKTLLKKGIKQNKIAEMFNVNKAIISKIKHKKIWFNV